MRTHSVGHTLDEAGAAAPAGIGCSIAYGAIDRQDVVPVHPDARHAVGPRLDGDGFRCRLLRRGHADRPVVVLTDQHAGHLEDGTEVHGIVEVGLTGGPVAHEAHRHHAVATLLGRPGRAHRLGDLRPDAARPGHLIDLASAHVAGHLAALQQVELIAEDLSQVLGQREPTGKHDGAFTQRRENPVAGLGRERDGDRWRLLSSTGAVETNPALSLQRDHARVQDARAAHLLVHGEQGVGRQERIRGGIGSAIVTDDSQKTQVGGSLLGAHGRAQAFITAGAPGSAPARDATGARPACARRGEDPSW